MSDLLSAEILRQLLDYDPGTGIFLWRHRKETSPYVVGWNKKFAGQMAGCFCSTHGYCLIGISNISYRAHRLAWLYMTGEWPNDQIDHIDGDKQNNRLDNLREATTSQNGCNRGKQRQNASGFKGVSLYVRGNYRRFTSFICIAGKTHYLGYFDTAEEAHQAYVEAAKLHHGEFARVA